MKNLRLGSWVAMTFGAIAAVGTMTQAAGPYTYDCICIAGDCRGAGSSDTNTAKLEVQSLNKIEVTWNDEEKPVVGTLDSTYRPRYNKDSYRYHLRGSMNSEGYSTDAIVQKVLISGGKHLKGGEVGGYVSFQSRGEGFFVEKYVCTRSR